MNEEKWVETIDIRIEWVSCVHLNLLRALKVITYTIRQVKPGSWLWRCLITFDAWGREPPWQDERNSMRDERESQWRIRKTTLQSKLDVQLNLHSLHLCFNIHTSHCHCDSSSNMVVMVWPHLRTPYSVCWNSPISPELNKRRWSCHTDMRTLLNLLRLLSWVKHKKQRGCYTDEGQLCWNITSTLVPSAKPLFCIQGVYASRPCSIAQSIHAI